jgi:hypothetical protein
MKLFPLGALVAALALATIAAASAQTSTRAVPQANGAQTTLPPAPAADTDVEIHFNDGRDYVGDAAVREPKRISMIPADKSTITFVNGSAPAGQYVVIPDGPGKITYANGSTLDAVFANGVPDGTGDFEVAGGLSYKGTFVAGRPTNGVATYPDGSVFTGDFSDGLPSGRGTFTTTGRVDRAEGTWSAGVFSGGTIAFRDGAKFVGNLDATGKIDGPVRFELPDGPVLTATFIDGKYSGRVLEHWPAGLGGDFAPRELIVDVAPSAPELNGAAKLTFANGNRLVGIVRGGEFNGPGSVSYRNGSAFRGTLFAGKFVGRIAWTNGRGTTIDGFVRRGRMQGPAVLRTRRNRTLAGFVSADGNFFTFTGPLDRDSRPNGRGTYGYADGEKLVGTYVHGRLTGPFVDRLTDGTVFYVDVRRPSYDLIGPARVVLNNGDVAIGLLARSGNLEGPGSYTILSSSETFAGKWVRGTFRIAPEPGG